MRIVIGALLGAAIPLFFVALSWLTPQQQGGDVMAQRWSEEEDGRLLVMMSSGLTLAQIADVMDCTRSMVAGRSYRLGVNVGRARGRQRKA